MIEYIPIDLSIHKSLLIDLNEEYLSWIGDEVKKHYKLDLISILGQSIRAYTENSIKELISYKPDEGLFYILQINDEIIGMDAFRKLEDNKGELKRMYIRQEFRGNGYGKALLKKLLDKGKEFGCSKILLDTGRFMAAAQHVYRSAGFREIVKYPETEVPLEMQPYWIYMEKIL
ncbi:MAG: GNAT family N-acetyltransferase [Candidatus Hodarchaeota archaeon]